MVSLLRIYHSRRLCFCGKPKGHTGWLVCVEKAASSHNARSNP